MMRGYLAVALVILGLIGLSHPAQAQTGRHLVSVDNAQTATACVSLAGGGHYGAFANSCDYQVQYTFCVENPAAGSYAEAYACKLGQRTQITQQIEPNGRTAAHNGNGKEDGGRVHWFACAHSYRMDAAGPRGISGDVVFDGSELRGRCANWVWEEASKPVASAANDPVARGKEAWRAGDYAAAVEAWRAPAAAGNADAQFLLGTAYGSGIGVPKDSTESLRLFRLAAAQGQVQANAAMGQVYRGAGRPREAIAFLEKGVAGGDVHSLYLLGMIYANGEGGVPVDLVRGRQLLEQAGARGDRMARNEVVSRGWEPAATAQTPPARPPAVVQVPAPAPAQRRVPLVSTGTGVPSCVSGSASSYEAWRPCRGGRDDGEVSQPDRAAIKTFCASELAALSRWNLPGETVDRYWHYYGLKSRGLFVTNIGWLVLVDDQYLRQTSRQTFDLVTRTHKSWYVDLSTWDESKYGPAPYDDLPQRTAYANFLGCTDRYAMHRAGVSGY